HRSPLGAIDAFSRCDLNLRGDQGETASPVHLTRRHASGGPAMKRAGSRLGELSLRAPIVRGILRGISAPALSPDAAETKVTSWRGGRSLLPPSFVRSLQYWLIFGGATLPAIKLAERSGDVPSPGTLIAFLMSLLVIVPV